MRRYGVIYSDDTGYEKETSRKKDQGSSDGTPVLTHGEKKITLTEGEHGGKK